MDRIHMRSLWLGAHGTLFCVALLLVTVSGWALLTVALSGLCLWANWEALKKESAA